MPLQRHRSFRHGEGIGTSTVTIRRGYGGRSRHHDDDDDSFYYRRHRGGVEIGTKFRHGRFHGKLCFKDKEGDWHCIVPHDRYSRRSLSYGFVPDDVLYLYRRIHDDDEPIYVPVRVPLEYGSQQNPVVILLERPRMERELENYEVLKTEKEKRKEEAKRAEEAEAEQKKAESFRSTLSMTLGGDGEVGESFALGENYLRKGKGDRAVRSFRRAAGQNPDDPVARLALGVAEFAAGNFEEAAEQLARAMERHPFPEKIRVNVRTYVGGTDIYRKRLSSLLAAARENRNNAGAHYVLGFLYFVDQYWAKALEHFREVERIDAGHSSAARLRAITVRRMRQKPEQED